MKTTFITRVGVVSLDCDLVRTKTLVLTCPEREWRYELHLDRTTAARIHHTGFRPTLRLDRELGPAVVFIHEKHPDEWFEWRCAEGGAMWFRIEADRVIQGAIA